MVDLIKMPSPFSVLCVFYAVYFVFCVISYIKDGYWSNMLIGTYKLFLQNIKMLFLLLIILLGVIASLDKCISAFCISSYNKNLYTLLDFICSMGEGWFVIGLIFTLGLIFTHLNKIKYATLMKISMMSAIYAGIFNTVIKFILNRQRPSVGLDPWVFFHFFLNHRENLNDLFYAYDSMPSGHTITVCAAVIPLFLYSKTKINRLVLLVPILLIMVARIYTVNHWVSDTLVAIMFGTIIGIVCYRNNQYRLVQMENN